MCDMIWTARLFKFQNRWVGQTHRTKAIFYSFKYLQTFKTSTAFNLSEYIFKTSSNSPDSLGQSSCTFKVQQLNEQISECSFFFFFLPCIYQMGRHLHAWGLKGKHIEGKYNPDLSSQIWVSYISDINKIFLFQDMCKGKSSGVGGGGGLQTCIARFAAPRYCIQLTAEDGSGANHRQTYPIQSWLWRENLINIITNEMEREEGKGLFSPAGWRSGVIGVKTMERERELAL